MAIEHSLAGRAEDRGSVCSSSDLNHKSKEKSEQDLSKEKVTDPMSLPEIPELEHEEQFFNDSGENWNFVKPLYWTIGSYQVTN